MEGRKRQTTCTRVLFSLAIVAYVSLFASECSRSHVQETVTVAPRATATPPSATTDVNSSPRPATVDAETEAAGDALAHAMVALKTRRRDEALYYINLARTHLTRRRDRPRIDSTTNSNWVRERLIHDLRELDVAEGSVRHGAYDQSRTQLLSISNELDHLH